MSQLSRVGGGQSVDQASGSCFMLTMIGLALTGAFGALEHAAKGDGEQFLNSPRCLLADGLSGGGGEA